MDPLDTRMLSLMVEKINRLIEVCEKHSSDEIKNNFYLSDTIQFEFEKLFEDTTRLSVLFKLDHPEFPFNKLRVIRNRVAHDYESVIIDVLIDSVKNDLPTLKEEILKVLS